jgi:hypothetical protein
MEWIGKMVSDISYNNAQNYFNLSAVNNSKEALTY